MENEPKKTRKTAKKSRGITLSAFTIILILTFVLAIITHLLPKAQYRTEYSGVDNCIVVTETGSVDEGYKYDGPGVCATEEDVLIDGSGVEGATLSQTLLAPILGFEDAIDVGIFILVLGGFLKIVTSTGALETGIQVLIKKLKGREFYGFCDN